MLKAIFISTIVFFTLFPINFIFLPSFASTRFILGIFGGIIWLLDLARRKRPYSNNILVVFLLTIIVSIWSILCTVIFNISYDYTYVKLPLTFLIMFFSCYFSVSIMKYFNKEVGFDLITKYFLYALILQSVIVLIQFFNPSLGVFLASIQRLGEEQVSISSFHLENSSRFIGFGLLFYTSSFFYGTALVLIAFQLRYKLNTRTNTLLYLLLYVFIFLVGMGLSRSTVIGFLSSLLVLFLPVKNIGNMLKILIRILFFGFFLLIAIVMIVRAFPNLNKELELLINNAFDFLISYFETGKVKSESASGTFDYFILPEKVRTYFVGTGFYETYYSIKDFNYSDIGYLRLLYYFGLPGLILFFWIEIKLLRIAFDRKGYSPIYSVLNIKML